MSSRITGGKELTTGNKPPVLCIVGPTATGKSDLGVRVAQEVGGEILSADSMQIYRRMDIGTAKLSESEMQGIPHHLLNIVEPTEGFSVANWVQLADTCIAGILNRKQLPIVVGGTGLYIRAIVEDLDFADNAKSLQIREKWMEFARQHGEIALHKILREWDEDAAKRLHPNDVRRVVRALEVIEVGGRAFSEAYDWTLRGGRYNAVQVGLRMERQQLYDRVELRVDKMLDRGLLKEVENLLRSGCNQDLISMQAIGYKELAAYFGGSATLEEAVALLKRNTRRFAKRQLSWFKRDDRIRWITLNPAGAVSPQDFAEVCEIARQLKAGILCGETE